MAEKKPVKKPAVAVRTKKAAPAAAVPVAKPVVAPQRKPAAAAPKAVPEARREEDRVREVAMPAAPKKPAVAGPTARACPLVLDGEVEVSEFSPKDCLSCGEFDCRFCESQHGSGSLRSRLFAGGDDGDEDGDSGGEDDFDLDFGEGDEGGDEDESEEEAEDAL